MATMVAVDTSMLVALVDARDNWHERAVILRDALLDTSAQLVYFDCVIEG